MSEAIFTPVNLGKLTLRNRFVRSATYEAQATEDGAVTPELIHFYQTLGKGQLGAIISGIAYVSPKGKGVARQLGIEREDRVEGFHQLAAAAQAEGSAFFVQLVHAGAQTTKMVTGCQPLGPTGQLRDPTYFEKPRALTVQEIKQIIADFGRAAARAVAAGADGVQIHAAHGYLLAQFLSPFFNRRTDAWGGSTANRFRLLGEVVRAVRGRVGDDVPVLVKLVHDDGTPQPGMTPELAADAAGRLAELGVAGVELSRGGTCWSPFQMCRGDVPAWDFARVYPLPLRPLIWLKLRRMANAATFKPDYNADAAVVVKRALGEVPLILVGGVRERASMERLVNEGPADLIALSRPLVRQPHLVKKLIEGEPRASCTSCNLCYAAVCHALPLRCYVSGLPV
jgi:2,4-dienoyl-CoA reductase-like NADH-dependent reductase (Old Yellow Enzyme family)